MSKTNTGHLLLDKEDEYLLPLTINSNGYAVKRIDGKLEYAHRIIMEASDQEIVDHINGNPLDNRKSNLRIVSKSQNNRNSSYKGYTKVASGKYQVKVSYKNKTIYIGTYDTPESASLAYKAVSKILFEITGIDVNKPEKMIELSNGKKVLESTIIEALKGLVK
jgi:hypothetical protein